MNNKIYNETDLILTWKINSVSFRERSSNWYWGFLILTGFILFLIYYFNIGGSKNSNNGNIILLILTSISSLTITMATFIKPLPKIYSISINGLSFSDSKKKIPLHNFSSYKIDFELKELLLQYKTGLKSVIVIPLSPLVNLKKLQNILETELKIDNEIKVPSLEKNIEHFLGI